MVSQWSETYARSRLSTSDTKIRTSYNIKVLWLNKAKTKDTFRHPYKQVIELLTTEVFPDFSLSGDAVQRKTYTAWLEENGTPECAWNSSLEKYFGAIDDQLSTRLEALKPKMNDTQLLTSYFGAQNTENNSTVFGFYQKYYENASGPPMIKVPNYQLNVRLVSIFKGEKEFIHF